MSGTETINEHARQTAGTVTVESKLEVVIIPVSDVERAKRFYDGLGWRLDADFAFDNGLRVVQFTPNGSGCSIQFGTNITSGEYEPTAPKHHWSGRYAAYVVARERGRTSDEAAKEARLHIEGAHA